MSAMTQLDADVAAVEPEMPVTFVFNGKSYTGQLEPSPNAFAMQDAGIEHTDSLNLNARLAIFAGITAPDKNDTVTVEDIDFRIESVLNTQDGVLARWRCVREN